MLPVEAKSNPRSSQGWTTYNGGKDNRHYSTLSQINTKNVHQLRMAWRFDAGVEGGLQTNPLIIGRTLYAYTSDLQVIALDATNGKLIWKFNSGVTGTQPSRGMTWWSGNGKDSHLFAFVANFVYALDPATGHPITSFGENGRIDLRKNLDSDYTKNSAIGTTPGVLYKDMLILGFRTAEAKPAPHGDIRAYDVRTGKLRWSFHTIPHPGEEGYKTWSPDAWKDAGAANNWSGMAVDEARGIVFAPTGSAVTDFYGADRVGDDLFADTLLALDANTGKRLWHFQDVHHDIWDRDFPSPPVLLTVRHDGKQVDALAQPTKQGFVFLFDRVTGKPLFPIEERPFPASDVPGEVTSPTQPVSLIPAPYARQDLTADMLTTRTPEAHAWAVAEFAKMRSGGLFVPFTVSKPTVVFPGFDGGAEWGGSAADPSGILYLNSNDIVWTGTLAANTPGLGPGASLYQRQCALCHGDDRHGSPPSFPSLAKIDQRLTQAQIETVIHNGKGRMPSFPNFNARDLGTLLAFLHTDTDLVPIATKTSSAGALNGGGSDPEGAKVYTSKCAICHGDDRRGAPSNYPALLGVRDRYSDAQILSIVHNGKGRMLAVKDLSQTHLQALLRYLGPGGDPIKTAESSDKQEVKPEEDEAYAPYRFTGYKKFLDPDGYPAVVPPWGTLNAIDLNTGKYLWKVRLGEYPELTAKGVLLTGTENYGGPIVTAGGVLFIGATMYDRKLRAFDMHTGALLWTGDLPYSGTATPATYAIDGKQYVVIATSGQRNRKGPQGAAYVAFSLP